MSLAGSFKRCLQTVAVLMHGKVHVGSDPYELAILWCKVSAAEISAELRHPAK